MLEIHGYKVDETKWVSKGGGGQCNIAIKGGKKYFIKELGPRYPVSDAYTAEEKAKKIQKCDNWFAMRKKVLEALPRAETGTIVKPVDFFREGALYYEVSPYVDIANIPYDEIWKESKADRVAIMKAIVAAMADVHSAGIVHGDLNPAEILISTSDNGELIPKIIDFSDSFFADNPPKNIIAREFWMSPEVVLYVKNREQCPNPYKDYISGKSDVFSLGVIFHQFCAENGEPPKCSTYPWQEFGHGKKPQVSSRIEPDIRTLIEKMLEYEPDNRPSMMEVKEYLIQMKVN